MSKNLVANLASKIGRNVITGQYVSLQMVFTFERARAFFADELGLHSTVKLQMF